MGQKVHPGGLRVGIIHDWKSNWCSDREFARYLGEDIKIREHIHNKLSHAGLSDIHIRKDSQKILKTLNPKASIPEYDIGETVDGKVSALEKKINDLTAALANKDELTAYSAEFEKAASKYGVTSEGREKVLKLMEEEKIRSPEAGILLFNERNPAPPPVTTSGWAGASVFDSVADDDMKGWFENTSQRRDEEIRAVLNERKTA